MITVCNVYRALDNAKKDEDVGIKITRLSGNDFFAFYAAEVEGYKRIRAHYHTEGIEIYQIVEGKGEIYTGNLTQSNKKVIWNKPIEVNKGDCFTVNENEVHQLVNNNSEKLIIIFACSYSHLNSDRIIAAERYSS